MTDFNFFLPLSKVEKQADGSVLVSGYASTPSLDLDGEIVSLDAVRKALPGYWQWRNIREMHQPSAVGVAQEANVDGKGLFLTSKITDPIACQKCIDRVYKGYSIGGKKLAKNGNTITDIELVEVSIVDRPANPDCKMEIAKSAKDGTGAFLTKLPKVESRSKILGKALGHMVTEFLDTPLEKDLVPGAMCKAHSVAGCAKCTCAKHGTIDCAKCAMKAAKKLAKREFTDAQRQQAADSGAAMPGGGYPIENEKDLRNAIQAIGRAKDPEATRKHIKQRAKALGRTDLIPEGWGKGARKLLARQAYVRALEKTIPDLTSGSATPSFLTLKADGDPAGVAEGRPSFSGHEGLGIGGMTRPGKDGTETEKFAKAYVNLQAAAASLRDDLSGQSQREFLERNFNMDNSALVTDRLGQLILDAAKAAGRPTRAGLMKAASENMKKARKARGMARDLIESVHKMHKSAYLAKEASTQFGKAKKPKDDGDGDDDSKEFDHQGAMEKLQKAFGALEASKTFDKAAKGYLAKAASGPSRSGQRGQEAADPGFEYEVPRGVKDLDPRHMATLSPGGEGSGGFPPELMLDSPAMKNAKKGAPIDLDRYIPKEMAELMAKNARLEAENDILARAPAQTGRRPFAFDMTKFGSNGAPANDGNPMHDPELWKGVDVRALGSTDDRGYPSNDHTKAAGEVVGRMILGGKYGKSVFNADFHGTGPLGKTA